MHRRIVYIAVVSATLSAAALAESARAPSGQQIKGKEQIRCELLGDCAPAVTRAVGARGIIFITRTGEAVSDRPRVQRELAQLAKSKGEPRTVLGRKGVAPKITFVRNSDLFINFASASSAIDDTAFAQATELYASLTPQEWGASRFEITGHTDTVGSASYNDDLSLKRAQAVIDLLVARGLDRSKLLAKGYGFRHPIIGLDRNDSRNRRVGITKLD